MFVEKQEKFALKAPLKQCQSQKLTTSEGLATFFPDSSGRGRLDFRPDLEKDPVFGIGRWSVPDAEVVDVQPEMSPIPDWTKTWSTLHSV